jgi:hypothetical protein
MSNIYWKRVVPNSIPHALQLCKEHAIKKNNQSVPRIADHLGESADLLYKWLGTAKMPVNKVIALEQACGINFVTQYLAQSQGFMLVPVPTGRKAENKELVDLQIMMTEVASHLIKFEQGKCEASEAIDAIKVLMQDLAYHEKNVAKVEQPQSSLNI